MTRSICLVLVTLLACMPALAQEKQPEKKEVPHIHNHPEWEYPNTKEDDVVKKVEDIARCVETHMRASMTYGAGELIKGNRKSVRQSIANWAMNKLIEYYNGEFYFGVRKMTPEALEKICDRKACAHMLKENTKEWEKIEDNKDEQKKRPWIEDPEKVQKNFEAQREKVRKALLGWLNKDNKNEVREQCAGFLPAISVDKEVVNALIDRLLNDGWSIVRAMAVDSLERTKDPSCIPALRKALEKDSYSTVRAAAADALIAFGDKDALGLFIKGLEDGWSNVRLACVRALAKFQAKEAIKPLKERLSDKKDTVREQAAISLGEMADASVLPALAKAAGDEYETVRESVYNSITNIGNRHKQAAGLAAEMLADRNVDDKSFEAKMPAVTELLELEGTGEAKALLDSLRKKDAAGGELQAARKAAYEAIGKLGERHRSAAKLAADKLVEKGLSDKVFNPRMKAVQGLLRLKDSRGIDALLEALKEKYEFRILTAIQLAVEEKVKDPRVLKALEDAKKSIKTEQFRQKIDEALKELEAIK